MHSLAPPRIASSKVLPITKPVRMVSLYLSFNIVCKLQRSHILAADFMGMWSKWYFLGVQPLLERARFKEVSRFCE